MAHMCCMQMSGIVAVVYGIGALVCDPHHDSLDVFCFDLVLADQIEQRIERRLDRRAHRPAFDVGIHDFVDRAEAAHQARSGSGLRP